MEQFSQMSTLGYITTIIVACFIFIILMWRGIKLGWGDKSILIGKKLESKFDSFKADIENQNAQKNFDENLQKALFKRAMLLDEALFADLTTSVKKLDPEVLKIFKPYVHCQFPTLAILDIVEDILMERVLYNNMKEKLTSDNNLSYLSKVENDLKDSYSNFYAYITGVRCGEVYPSWDDIKKDMRVVIVRWATKCAMLHIETVNKKIEMYKKSQDAFLTENLKNNAVLIPLEKNKKYLEKWNSTLNMLKGLKI